MGGWAKVAGIAIEGLGAHRMRANAPTSALEHCANIVESRSGMGHANIGTTRLYDRRGTCAEGSTTNKVQY